MPQPSALRVWSALLVVYVIWGSTYLGIRYAVGVDENAVGLPPILMAGTRFTLAGIVLFALSVRRPAADGRPDPLGRAQWRSTAVVGICLVTAGNGLVVLAEDRGVPSGIAAVILATLPLWMALMSAARGDERIPRVGVAGLLLGLSGVAILANPFSSDRVEGVGTIMLITAALSWSWGSVWSRRAAMPRRPLVMTGMEMLCGGGALLVISLVTGDAFDLEVGRVSASAWWGLVYLWVLGSMVAFTTYIWLLSNVRLSLVATYAYVNPVVAVFLGVVLLSEPLTARTLVATAVICLGVALIVATRRPVSATPTPKQAAEQSLPAA